MSQIPKIRPNCLECGAPADVLVTDDEPYCAKHGLPRLQKQKSSWKNTVNNRSTRHASRYVIKGA